MSISPAGLLFILLVGYLFLNKKNLFNRMFLLCLIIETFIRMGNFIKIGEKTVPLELTMEYIMIFICITRLGKIPQRYASGWIILLFSYVLPILLLILFPSDILTATPAVTWDDVMFNGASLQHPTISASTFLVTGKMLFFALVVVYIYKTWKLDDYSWIIRRFSKISVAFLFLGIIECIARNFGLNEIWGQTMELFWGDSENTVFVSNERGGLYTLNLFTLEPAHYAYSLMFVCIVKLVNNILNDKKWKIDIPICVALALMWLSTSFSAVYLSLSFFLIYILHRWYIQIPKSVRIEKVIMLVSLIVTISSISIILSTEVEHYSALGRLFNMYDHIDEIFSIEWNYGSTMGDHSTQVRIASMIQTIVAFFKRPLFGYSLMAIDAHSPTAMLLSGVGIFGLICWIRFYFYLPPLKKLLNPLNRLYLMSLVLYLLTNLFGGGGMRAFFGPMLMMTIVCYCVLFSINTQGLMNKN